MSRPGWLACFLGASLLMPIEALHAQHRRPATVAAPTASYEDELQGIFAALQRIAPRLAAPPDYETFRPELMLLQQRVGDFRSAHGRVVDRESPDSFPRTVVHASELVFAGADFWDQEIFAGQALARATGTLQPLRARADRDAARRDRLTSWNLALQWLQYASGVQMAPPAITHDASDERGGGSRSSASR